MRSTGPQEREKKPLKHPLSSTGVRAKWSDGSGRRWSWGAIEKLSKPNRRVGRVFLHTGGANTCDVHGDESQFLEVTAPVHLVRHCNCFQPLETSNFAEYPPSGLDKDDKLVSPTQQQGRVVSPPMIQVGR